MGSEVLLGFWREEQYFNLRNIDYLLSIRIFWWWGNLFSSTLSQHNRLALEVNRYYLYHPLKQILELVFVNRWELFCRKVGLIWLKRLLPSWGGQRCKMAPELFFGLQAILKGKGWVLIFLSYLLLTLSLSTPEYSSGCNPKSNLSPPFLSFQQAASCFETHLKVQNKMKLCPTGDGWR